MGVPQAPTTTSSTTKTNTFIEKTKNYDMFKMLPHNRPIVQSHVIRLAQSMTERPHLRPARPVLVNEKLQVIDGQHRLKASELNGQEVFYMVVRGLTIEDARVLNALQRTWSILDYAYSYASSRVPAYVQFVKTYEAHKLPPSIVLEFMAGQPHKLHHIFRVGELQTVDQKQLDAMLDQAEAAIVTFPKTASASFVAKAYRTATKVEGFDPVRLAKKLETARPEPQKDRVSYVRELERIYNSDVTFGGPNYLRFF